jgi:hypothetical protein
MRLFRLAAGLSAALACSSLMGCGDEKKKSDPEAEATAQVTPALASLINAICEVPFRCCGRGEVNYFLGPYVSDLNCADRLQNSSELGYGMTVAIDAFPSLEVTIPNFGALRRGVAEKRVMVDEEAVLACVEHLAEQDCNEPPEEEVERSCILPLPIVAEELEEDPCNPELLFHGQMRVGDPCTSGTNSLECGPGLTCRGTYDALGVFGECVRPGQLGDSCFSGAECDTSLYCSALDATCQKLRGHGEACTFADRDDPSPDPSTALVRCEPGLSCDPITDTCVYPCERGATCTDDLECNAEDELLCIAGRCDKLRQEDQPCEEHLDCEEGLQCAVDPEDDTRTICTGLLDNGDTCFDHAECKSSYCEATEAECADPEEPGELCPSQDDAQCEGGACVTEGTSCLTDDDCPNSGACNTTLGFCAYYCLELRPDGAACDFAGDCASGVCIQEICATPPLANGENCDDDLQCESEFCSPDPDDRKCVELPLDLGEPCSASIQCESLVCFASSPSNPPTCTAGLSEGEACGQPDQEPCNPKELYCDRDGPRDVCAPFRETGEECEFSVQCRGGCELRFNRMMCSAAPAEGAAICDGEEDR